MNLLQAIESKLRAVRSFVLPSHIATYRRLCAERATSGILPDAPVAVLDLKSLESDADAGRFVYLTYRRLRAAGYTVIFRDRFRTLASFQARRYKRLLLGHPFGVARDVRTLNGDDGGRAGLWISDSQGPLAAGARGHWTHIRIVYDRRLPAAANEVAHTFAMHPDVYEHGHLIPRVRARSGAERWCRIFFAGNTNPRLYAQSRMGVGHPVLARGPAVEIARAAAGGALTTLHARDCETRTVADGKLEFATTSITVALIETSKWLHVLSGASFFLAAPGATYPLSHNAVEAMHAGAVPILQYPQYFDPPLRHGVNCIVYRDAAELEQRIHEVLAMDEDRIALLRDAAVAYYEKYLRLERLIEHLVSVAQAQSASGGDGEARLLFHSFVAPRGTRPD